MLTYPANNKDINFNGSAIPLFPVELVYGLLWDKDENAIALFPKYPFKNGWGGYHGSHIIRDESLTSLPVKASICYLSVTERKFYECDIDLTDLNLSDKWNDCGASPYEGFLIGMAPYGIISLWMYGQAKSILLATASGNPTVIDLDRYVPCYNGESLDEHCMRYIRPYKEIYENYVGTGLPPKKYFRNRTQQYRYKYACHTFPAEEDEAPVQLSEAEDFTIKEYLFDGSYNKLEEPGLCQYHLGGIPEMITVRRMLGKHEYSVNLFFNEDMISEVFERFYGAHPDTTTDFIIRMDVEKKKYELALYRQGLKEPVVIPEAAYQLIVFKNKFEDYRSENYDQPSGAWVW